MKKNNPWALILSALLSLAIALSFLPPLTAYAQPNTPDPTGNSVTDQIRGEENEKSVGNPFIDVNTGDYYLDPVVWALARGITQGTSANTFSPNSSCTRAQIVTFLWRANGSPEPTAATSPFEDVTDQSAYYYKAVLWAAENGITAGVSKTRFGPDDVCTRGQVVTFLHNTAQTPPHSAANPFHDVTISSYYYNAALWAYENSITAGVSETRFAPNDICTRGQIVTFLYRAQAYFEPDCVDADKDHSCDYGCGKSFGKHADADRDHACDYGCSDSFGECVDADMNHTCDYGCGKNFGKHADADRNHACDYGCSDSFGQCVDADNDQTCDYGCGKSFGEHTEENTEIMHNWRDYFEINKTEQVVNIAERLVPNHQYYFAIKAGADRKPNNFEETIVSYRYNVKRFYYTIGTNGEIVIDSDGQLTETKTETKSIGRSPCLLAEKGVHGHTSTGRFFVYLPTDIEIIRVEKKLHPESLDYYISFETNGLISAELAEKIQNLIYETYPPIFEYFSDGYYEKISCEIKSFDGVAYTSGRSIFVNADYLNQNPQDLDCITHELVHCAQAYGGNPPGWLTDGIADYGRYLFGLYNEDSGWNLPDYSEKQSYTNSYRVTAAFLKYVVEHHAEDFVRVLNTALQNNTYTEDLWKTHTGYTVDELWKLYADANKANS